MAKTFIIHDESVNSHGYWMMTSGCDISQFEKNPIMLWNHNNAWGDTREAKLPIGHWENIRIKGKQILADPVFDSDEFSQMIAKKVEANTLRMASVGAMPVEMSEDKKYIKPGQRYATIIKWKLKEASIVNIGANNNALVALYDDAGVVISLSGDSNSPLKPLNIKKEMNEKLLKLLNLSDDSGEDTVFDAVKKIVDENIRLKDEDEKRVKREKEAGRADFSGNLDAGIKDGRIDANGKEKFLELYDANPEAAKSAFDAVSKRKPVTEAIEESKGKDAAELLKFSDKSWDELDRDNKLIMLKDNYPDVFKEKYKEKFGIEPNM